ncbi:MAG: hypothetical protein RLY20_120 [Verrucomicrobiota bacterium]|jgi:hypothetical protein
MAREFDVQKDRKIEKDLFPDQQTPKKSATKSPSISFLLGPKQPQQRHQYKPVGLNLDLDGSLKWAKFVENPKILKSKNRKELKEYLKKLLAGLEERYTAPTDWAPLN